MKTKNILLISGIGIIAYVFLKNNKKNKSNVVSESISVPASTSLTITPINANSPTYARNGIYLGYPTMMQP